MDGIFAIAACEAFPLSTITNGVGTGATAVGATGAFHGATPSMGGPLLLGSGFGDHLRLALVSIFQAAISVTDGARSGAISITTAAALMVSVISFTASP